MSIRHIAGLISNPEKAWHAINERDYSLTELYVSYMAIIAAIPALCWFIGTTHFGWSIGGGSAVKLTDDSALTIMVLFYFAQLVAIFIIGAMIFWMAKTYGTDISLNKAVSLSAFTTTPVFLIGIFGLYPLLWLDIILALIAGCYAVYLLYTGVPIIMNISKEKGFLFSSAILGVCLIGFVALMAATIILWSFGAGPVFTS